LSGQQTLVNSRELILCHDDSDNGYFTLFMMELEVLYSKNYYLYDFTSQSCCKDKHFFCGKQNFSGLKFISKAEKASKSRLATKKLQTRNPKH